MTGDYPAKTWLDFYEFAVQWLGMDSEAAREYASWRTYENANRAKLEAAKEREAAWRWMVPDEEGD
jgi:hypothetical protein